MSGDAPADFERCLELAAHGLHQDELFATLTALVSYYVPRAELRRAHELLDSLAASITRDRPWLHQAIASSMGSITWLEGNFTVAREHLLRAVADWSAPDPRDLDTAWRGNTDPISGAHTYLALSHLIAGDLPRAKAELAASVRRCDELGFPLNAFNRAHTYFKEIWVCLEAGQIDEATALCAEMRRCTENSGLDLWRFVSATQHATVKAVATMRAGADADTLEAAAAKIARGVDASRLLHLKVYLTFHDAVIGRLLIAAGQTDKARTRLEMSLQQAGVCGMHFHDAELMRLRAHTLPTESARRAALADALKFARGQGATLFELRCLLDSFELFGDGDREGLATSVQRFGSAARWPEHAQAERILS